MHELNCVPFSPMNQSSVSYIITPVTRAQEGEKRKLPPPQHTHSTHVNFQMFKLVLEKAEEPEIKLPTSAGSLKKQESSRKTSISALLTMPKPLTVWITKNCGKF